MAAPALWLYRALAGTAFPIVLPWLLIQDRRRGKRRPSIAQRLGRNLPEIPVNGVWIQAVSVGEVAVARPLIVELRRRHPSLPLVLSATTATGLALARSQQLADTVVPFPVDLPGPVRRFLDRARPCAVVLVETELWPEMLAGCAARGVPVVVVNARVSDRSFAGYHLIAGALRPLLAPVTLALAQTEQDAARLIAMGVARGRVRVTGNIKFDAAPPAPVPRLLEQIRALAGDRPVVVAGSTMEGEDAVVLDAIGGLPAGHRPFLVLAPRHPERVSEACAEIERHGLSFVRRSQLDGDAGGSRDVAVIDTIGELGALYGLATVAFIGGSLVPTGGHNPIEAARFGVPVLTGPHVHNFAAVYRGFVKEGAARLVHDRHELTGALGAWLADPAAAGRAGEAGRALLARNAGATARVADALDEFLR